MLFYNNNSSSVLPVFSVTIGNHNMSDHVFQMASFLFFPAKYTQEIESKYQLPVNESFVCDPQIN